MRVPVCVRVPPTTTAPLPFRRPSASQTPPRPRLLSHARGTKTIIKNIWFDRRRRRSTAWGQSDQNIRGARAPSYIYFNGIGTAFCLLCKLYYYFIYVHRVPLPTYETSIVDNITMLRPIAELNYSFSSSSTTCSSYNFIGRYKCV